MKRQKKNFTKKKILDEKKIVIAIARAKENSQMISENLKTHPSVMMTEAPLMDVSSTMIRQAIKDKKDMSFFVPQAVWQYLDEMNFYKK